MPGKRQRRKFGPSQKHRIFFACLPDRNTAARIHAFAEDARRAEALEASLILREHLHVTLFHLGDWAALPDEIVDLAKDAASRVDVPAFEVAFVRAESFRNRTGIYPFVLTSAKEGGGWQPLHTALGHALQQVGLGGATQGEFKPHITLTYDKLRAKPSAIEPIVWTVRAFSLIHSELGKATHHHLGHWPLRASRY